MYVIHQINFIVIITYVMICFFNIVHMEMLKRGHYDFILLKNPLNPGILMIVNCKYDSYI